MCVCVYIIYYAYTYIHNTHILCILCIQNVYLCVCVYVHACISFVLISQREHGVTWEGKGRKKAPPSRLGSHLNPFSFISTCCWNFGYACHHSPRVFFKQPGPGFEMHSHLRGPAPVTTRPWKWPRVSYILTTI